MDSVGPKPKVPHWRHSLPNSVPGTARGRMGRRVDPYRHVENHNAKRRRDERDEGGDVFKVITSQLIVARRRRPNPARDAVILQHKVSEAELKTGASVRFVRPGPKKWSAPCTGTILAFPDKKKKFVAIDRRGRSHRSVLSWIEVVPARDVWLDSS